MKVASVLLDSPTWLLDVNMPRRLAALLESEGIKTDTDTARGWGNLSNGALLEAAAAAGFRSILTRDRLFGASASAFERFPEFSVVLVTFRSFGHNASEAFQAPGARPIVPRGESLAPRSQRAHGPPAFINTADQPLTLPAASPDSFNPCAATEDVFNKFIG